MEWNERIKEMEGDCQMKSYILDASVAIKWFSEYDEDDLDKALQLRFQILNKECEIIVPDLIFYELSNALRYNTRLTESDVKAAVQSLIDMEFDVKVVESRTAEHAIEIAYAYNVSVYDSYYLALAHLENKPLVTADYKFAERIKKFKYLVRLSQL